MKLSMKSLMDFERAFRRLRFPYLSTDDYNGKESGCEVFTEFPYDEYDIDGVDEPEDEEDETETGE